MSDRPRLVVLDGHALNPGDLSWDPLRELADLGVFPRTPESQVVERAAGAELVLTNKTPLREATLRQLPSLRYIGVIATGYDVVDVKAARSVGITVTNVPAYGTASVAQFVFALLLELCHRVGSHAEGARGGEWSRSPDWSDPRHPLMELAGKRLGVVGYGRIGREVTRIAGAFRMEVVAHTRRRDGAEPVPWVPLDELLATADVVTLHCPLTPETRGMINADALSRMKETAYLVNTARGGLVVEEDLRDALAAGQIAGAALDVLSAEPPPLDHPLLSAPNCLVTPHIAWATKEARSRLLTGVAQNVAAFLSGSPVNVV